MSLFFNVSKLVKKLAEEEAPIRKLKVDGVKVTLDKAKSKVKTSSDLDKLFFEATYEHNDEVKHTFKAEHGWDETGDKLTIDNLAKKTGLDIDLHNQPTITLGSVDAKFTIEWVDGATQRKYEVYVKLANTVEILLQAGILLSL